MTEAYPYEGEETIRRQTARYERALMLAMLDEIRGVHNKNLPVDNSQLEQSVNAKSCDTPRMRLAWTVKEQAYLRSRWGFVPVSELASRLRRSTDAIRNKANDLGLECDPVGAHLHPRVAALLMRGLTYSAIAELTGATLATMRSVDIRLRLHYPAVLAEQAA